MGSWQAFDMSRRPWVDVNAIPAEELTEIIDRCPSGVLRYEFIFTEERMICKVKLEKDSKRQKSSAERR